MKSKRKENLVGVTLVDLITVLEDDIFNKKNHSSSPPDIGVISGICLSFPPFKGETGEGWT